jgi:hypothetical protein
MTTTKHFWMTRASEALDNAVAAPSERTRAAYLELVRHYWSMHELVHGPKAGAAAARKDGRGQMPQAQPVQGRVPDFQSVHDALMRAA